MAYQPTLVAGLCGRLWVPSLGTNALCSEKEAAASLSCATLQIEADVSGFANPYSSRERDSPSSCVAAVQSRWVGASTVPANLSGCLYFTD